MRASEMGSPDQRTTGGAQWAKGGEADSEASAPPPLALRSQWPPGRGTSTLRKQLGPKRGARRAATI
jgi:hypothetical protein